MKVNPVKSLSLPGLSRQAELRDVEVETALLVLDNSAVVCGGQAGQVFDPAAAVVGDDQFC
jgi:hypothetical protein